MMRCTRCGRPISYGSPFIVAKPNLNITINGHPFWYINKKMHFCCETCMDLHFGILRVRSLDLIQMEYKDLDDQEEQDELTAIEYDNNYDEDV